jgi:hypothetical protein
MLKNVIFWDATTFGPCKNRRFGGTYRLLLPGENNHLGRKMLEVSLSETSVLTRATLSHIHGDDNLRSQSRRNLKSYIMKTAVFWDLMTQCDSGKNRHFGRMYRLNLQGENLSPLDSHFVCTSRLKEKRTSCNGTSIVFARGFSLRREVYSCCEPGSGI